MQVQKANRVAFLFGSGISTTAGMPKTNDLTKKIISGEGVMRHSDGNYYFDQSLYAHLGATDEYILRVIRLLNRVKLEIDKYYREKPERYTNYEDLYYVTSQVHDSMSGDYDNPAVQPLIDKIVPEIEPLLAGRGLLEFTTEATNYIHDLVWKLLDKKPEGVDYLQCVKGACLDRKLSNIDIFTLNHDIVIEWHLLETGTQFTDGFGKPFNDVRYWNPDLFKNECYKVRLFKLHGSVNWFRFRPDGGDRGQETIGSIPLGHDFEHTRNPAGKMQLAIEGRPMFLLGTFNKMLKYTSGIYIELFYQFYRSLRQTRWLVVCGYGFCDKGVNTQIKEWVYSSPDKKIIIVHPDVEKLKIAARGAISYDWENLERQGKIIVIQKRIEETSWQDMNENISS